MTDDQTPINARPRRRAQVALESASLALRDRLLWPVEDRLFALDERGRLIAAGFVASLAAVLAIGGVALVGSGGGGGVTASEVAATTVPRSVPAPPETADSNPAPTLHGATPVFSDGGSDSAPTPAAETPTGESAEGTAATGSAATAKISTTPSSGATAHASSAAAALEGPPAGPEALAVARQFARAFVVYETGGEETEVTDAFTKTTTPELRKALLERPPRQPAGVEVPKAKVVNVVPAPSHGTVFPVSVSLLRLDVTSELRLELERLKGKRWRVVDVLG